MTPEFGAASQLEKIDMLDFADAVAINKFDRRGGEDALRDVRRQLARTGEHPGVAPEELPVFGTVASRFNDDGVTALYQFLRDALAATGLPLGAGLLPPVGGPDLDPGPGHRAARTGTGIWPTSPRRCGPTTGPPTHEAGAARRRQQLARRRRAARGRRPRRRRRRGRGAAGRSRTPTGRCPPASRDLLDAWPAKVGRLPGRPARPCCRCPGTPVPRVALPRFTDDGELLRWLRSENLPGEFPYTAGVFPFKREGEDPARMFAGEGDAFRTNRRFHLLAAGQPATRLSTAFDSVTLYGFDPDVRPDIYGKVGNSGVSIATLDDMKALYRRLRSLRPDHLGVDDHQRTGPHHPGHVPQHRHRRSAGPLRGRRPGRPPTAAEAAEIRARTLRQVRGTVQADILKEDQGQNTCIFSTEFSLRVMADIQEWFIANEVRNFYSVSISGYHIAEAGANPISQLAFTLANGFTYVEAYLARGMDIDDFAPNFSFFFSNGMDPEYTVIGRVARRIWAVAMRDRYGANARSQKLKYHIQTSGRSLHAQEMAFNDIRTTLQALCAIYDNANSLHTNAYDEAVTTPTAESVRRALAIQMIINQEWGLARNENPLQGSFVVEELTDLVEEAVLAEMERLSERGGVLGAMETGYQRGRIQDESMLYESKKHDGSLPIIGVNTFRNPAGDAVPDHLELARSTEEEKQGQLRRLADFHAAHAGERPGRAGPAPRGRPRRGQRLRRAHGRRAGRAAWARSPTPCSRWAGATAATSSHRQGAAHTGGVHGVLPRLRYWTGASTDFWAERALNWSNRTLMTTTYELSHLRTLEAEAVHIFREVAAGFERPVLLFSGGKDSVVMLHVAAKAFWPAPLPFPVMHVDTGHNLDEVIEFRDRTVDRHGGPPGRRAASRTTSTPAGWSRRPGPQASRNRLQTVTLLRAIREHRFDAVFGGARRDEEKARAKERVFSFRDEFGQWDPRNQRPELWNLYNGGPPQGRAHPGVPAVQLDRARHLAVHPRRGDRAALAVLRPPAPGVRARRHAAGRLAVS